MEWSSGDRVLIKYRGFPVWHERLVGPAGDGVDMYYVVTPDRDMYQELLVPGEDVERVVDERLELRLCGTIALLAAEEFAHLVCYMLRWWDGWGASKDVDGASS